MRICGLDEAGRGAIFGPVVVAGCILPRDTVEVELADSKKLSSSSRIQIFHKLLALASDYYVIAIGPRRIDKFNILQATLLGFELCMKKLEADIYIVDGPHAPKIKKNVVAEAKADTKYNSVMAAAIIAKVTRDSLISAMGAKFTGFSLEAHKGYPTKLHRLELEKFGPTIFHRKSFNLVPEREDFSITNKCCITNIGEYLA